MKRNQNISIKGKSKPKTKFFWFFFSSFESLPNSKCKQINCVHSKIMLRLHQVYLKTEDKRKQTRMKTRDQCRQNKTKKPPRFNESKISTLWWENCTRKEKKINKHKNQIRLIIRLWCLRCVRFACVFTRLHLLYILP